MSKGIIGYGYVPVKGLRTFGFAIDLGGMVLLSGDIINLDLNSFKGNKTPVHSQPTYYGYYAYVRITEMADEYMQDTGNRRSRSSYDYVNPVITPNTLPVIQFFVEGFIHYGSDGIKVVVSG